MQLLLFDIEKTLPLNFCRSCKFRERHYINDKSNKVNQYCGLRKNKRNHKRLLKIKVTDTACIFYINKNQ